MTLRRSLLIAVGLLVAAMAAQRILAPHPPPTVAHALPHELDDQEFWRLSTAFSEDGGTFHSDNFVSNETGYQTVIPELLTTARPGGLYVGVGPEQNFTYIAALRPAMAFIVDIRRGNLHEHLLYKALFELSADRAEFLARLFSRPKLDRVGPDATPEQLFAAIHFLTSTEERYRDNLKAVTDQLTVKHALPLDAADLEGIEYVYRIGFFEGGPELNYRRTDGSFGRSTGMPTYAQLMAIDDGAGVKRSFLATEANFQAVKAMHARNLVVPVVGDFGGRKALRAVGAYARDHRAVVSAFYLSNVEQYLRQDGKWNAFCQNVASMPLDAASTFIRSVRGGRFAGGLGGGFIRFQSLVGSMSVETSHCGARTSFGPAGPAEALS